jgi:3'(2'), 5'-bisphosphate nucleotidase
VVEEAGGQASDLDGWPLDFSAGIHLSHNRGILVTNGILHNAFIGALSEIKI